MVSQVGRPDDGTDTAGFFNTEYFVDLKPKDQWRPVFHQNKEELIAAMDRELEKIPGALWNFSQPIADNMEEAVSGVKGQLAIKIYGDDLKTLEAKGDEIVNVMRTVRGIADLGLFRVIGQPNLEFEVDRDKAARYGINVADVQDAIETAVGGKAVTPGSAGRAALRPGGALSGAIPQHQGSHREHPPAGAHPASAFRWRSSATCRCSTALRRSIAKATRATSPSNTACAAAIWAARWKKPCARVDAQVKLPAGYHIDWAGEYESAKRSSRRLMIVVPITLLVICMILYTMFKSFKWVLLILANVAMAPLGGLLALLLTGTHFSVSSGVGFLALFGVSVQTGVIMLEYINQLRVRGHNHPGGGHRWRGPAAAAHHDDDAGGELRPAAGGAIARHRFRFAAPLRHRDRGRPGGGADPRDLPAADALRLGRGRARCIARSGRRSGISQALSVTRAMAATALDSSNQWTSA